MSHTLEDFFALHRQQEKGLSHAICLSSVSIGERDSKRMAITQPCVCVCASAKFQRSVCNESAMLVVNKEER